MLNFFKYILIYILLIMTSSIIYAQYMQIIWGIALVIAINLILLNKVKLNYKFIKILISITVLFIFLYLYSNGSYTIMSMLNTLSMIVISYVYINYIGDEFIDRYINIIVFIVIISIFGYINDLTGIGNVIINKLPRLITYNQNLSSVRGGFLFAFHKMNHIGRNSGFCIEPGKFQYFINLALIFLIYFKKIYIKNINFKLVILIIGVITTFSLGAYIITIIILIPYMLNFRFNNKLKILVLLLCTISICANINIINEKIISKASFDFKTGKFAEGSGNTRLNDIKLDIEIFKENILGNGWKEYEKKWTYRTEGLNYTKGSSSSSLTSTLAVYGIVIWIYILFLYYISIRKLTKRNLSLKIILLIFVFWQSLTQSFLITPLSFGIWFLDYNLIYGEMKK